MLTCLGSPSLGPCPKKSAYNCEYNSIGIYRAYAYNCEYNSIGIYRAYSGWYGCRYMIWESLTTHDCPITSILHSGHHEQHALTTAAQQLSLPLLLALVCLHWNSLIFPWIAVSWCCCFLRGNVDRCYSIPLSHRISRQSLQAWPKIVPRHLHSVYASLEPFARPHVALLTVSLRLRLPGNKTIVFNSGFKWRSFATLRQQAEGLLLCNEFCSLSFILRPKESKYRKIPNLANQLHTSPSGSEHALLPSQQSHVVAAFLQFPRPWCIASHISLNISLAFSGFQHFLST